MKRAKVVIIGAVMASLVISLGACSETSKPAGEQTLEVVSYHPEGTPLYDRLASLAEEFEAANDGLTVELTFGGGPGLPPIMTRYRAGDPPDVNPIMAGQCPTGELLEAGLTYDLSDAMNEELGNSGKTWREAIYPSLQSQIESWDDGSVCMAPESVTIIQFFYNKAIFDENGFDPPSTVNDLVKIADELAASGVAPFAVTGTFAYYMQMYFDYLLLRHVGAAPVMQAIGGAQTSRDPFVGERPLFADLPGVMDAAKDLQRIVSGNHLIKGFRSTDFTAAQMAFFQGDAAMILMGSWLASEMADAIPDGFEMGTFAFPSVPGASGDQASSFGNLQGLVVAAEGKNPEMGAKWLKFLASKEVQDKYASDFGVISAYTGVAPPPGFENVGEILADGELQPSYFRLLGQTAEIQAAFQEPMSQLFFGEIDAATMVQEISQRLDAANS